MGSPQGHKESWSAPLGCPLAAPLRAGGSGPTGRHSTLCHCAGPGSTRAAGGCEGGRFRLQQPCAPGRLAHPADAGADGDQCRWRRGRQWASDASLCPAATALPNAAAAGGGSDMQRTRAAVGRQLPRTAAAAGRRGRGAVSRRQQWRRAGVSVPAGSGAARGGAGGAAPTRAAGR